MSGIDRHLFGTDGVRDVANSGNMTPEFALSIGAAYVRYMAHNGLRRPRIVVCRDTRVSGQMIESALIAGMMSEGAVCETLGIFPTPGASYILRQGGHDAGAVISASHNPAEYNGIKFFDGSGSKLTDEAESEIERLYEYGPDRRPSGIEIGRVSSPTGLREGYVDWLRESVASVPDTSWTVVVDAANGAAAEIVRDVWSPWRGEIIYRGTESDGVRINDGVGVMNMDGIRYDVVTHGARLGIAYDGDTDRVLLCDSRGRIIDGDIIMWVVSRYLSSRGVLGSGLVATVMSNMALEEKLADENIAVFRCQVGDRYVLEKMRSVGSRLGGEQSGHVIASDHSGTGDGLCTGIFFIRACAELGIDIDSLADKFVRYPQVLRNVKTPKRDEIMSSSSLADAVASAEDRLDGIGRVLIRPSGTEPLIRILVEAKDAALMEETADILERVVRGMA